MNKLENNYLNFSALDIAPGQKYISLRTSPSQGEDPLTWQQFDYNFELLRYTINEVIDEFAVVRSEFTYDEEIASLQSQIETLTSDLNTTLGDYVLTTTLNTTLQNYVETVDLQNYVETTDLQSYALKTDIIDSYTKTESDEKYAEIGASYTKAESDNNFLSSTASLSIDYLSDVDTSSTGHVPVDGQALIWDEEMGHWMPGTVSTAGSGNFVLGDQIYYVANMPLGRFEIQKGNSHPYYRDTAPVWSSGTTYNEGDVVKVLDTRSTISGEHYLYYKALSTTTTQPPSSSWTWITTSYIPFYGTAGWPWNFVGTKAATVVQVHHDTDIDNFTMEPGAVFDFEVSGGGYVDTSVYDFSGSIHWGVQSSTRKYDNGSAQCFTAVGGLHEIAPGGYNEVGLFQGEAANLGSAYGTMSGVEVRLKDTDKDGYGNKTVSFDTKMNSVIGRIMREHNGERDVNCFVASSEGTVPVDTMLTAYTSPETGGGLGGGVFKEGVDISNANLTTGGAVIIHEGDQIKGSDDNGTRYSVMRMGTDKSNPCEVWVNNSWKKVEVGPVDSGGSGYRALRVLN